LARLFVRDLIRTPTVGAPGGVAWWLMQSYDSSIR
jgi:hypothetical protein